MTQNQRLPTTNGDFEALKRQVEALERVAARSVPPIVTTLPTNPILGDECVLVANAATGLLWPLRYMPDGSGMGWKAIGANPMTSYSAGGGPFTYTVASSWVTGYGGAALVVPVLGDYLISHSVSLWSNTALGTVMYSAVQYSNATVQQLDLLQNQTPGCWLTCSIVNELQTGVPTGSVEQVFNIGAASTVYTGSSRLSITPVRLLG